MPSPSQNDLLNEWVAQGYSQEKVKKMMEMQKKQETSIKMPLLRRKRAIGMSALPWGALESLTPITMDTNDPLTIKAGLMQRLMRVCPIPNKLELAGFTQFVKKWVKKNLSRVNVMSFEEWLETTNYNQQRKEQLREAYDNNHGCVTARDAHRIKMHVKREDYAEYKHARMINSRVDTVKVVLGPAFKSIEEELYKHSYFVKHMTPDDRCRRIVGLKAYGHKVYASDFTAFESHFTSQVQQACEFVLYEHCLSKYPKLLNTMKQVLLGVNKLSTRNRVKAFVCARRMSGEMNTSLGNGFTNLMLSMYLSQRGGSQYFDAVVEGDDALIITDATLTKEQYADLGFTIKIEEVSDVCGASFCGLVFSDAMQCIKDPKIFFRHFGWTESYLFAKYKTHLSLLHARALSALHELGQCPIIGAAARYALNMTSSYKPLFTDRYKERLFNKPWVACPLKPAMSTRMLFEDKFGISVSQQILIERDISCGRLDTLSNLLCNSCPDQHDYRKRFYEPLYVG